MKIHKSLDTFNAIKPVVTTGTFDGVHIGHQKIIERLKEIAKEVNGETVIFTFYPHPRKVVAAEETNLRLLTTLEEKIAQFEKAGMDHLIIFPFTKEFAQLTYSEFVEQILVYQIKTHFLVIGYDHKFGKNREGGFEFLKKCSKRFGFMLEQIDVLTMNDINISSTKIRKALQNGNIKKANHYLGYCFTLHGSVIAGEKLGRKIQFPTANIEASDPNKIIPGYGVYIVNVNISGKTYHGMLNIGSRPTVNSNADNRSIEVHLLNFNEDIYGHKLEIIFLEKLREERRFESLDALKQQLELDKTNTIRYFNPA